MRKNLILMLFSVFFTLLLFEGVLRLTGAEQKHIPEKPKENWAQVPESIWTEYHPELGWYHQKNKTALLERKQFKVTVHTNDAGFRGTANYALTKTAGQHRIVVLGDSFTFGFGVEDDQTFPALLEKKIPDTEVINLGIPGYGIDQMLEAYRTIAAKYHPDKVLIAVFPEDFWRSTRAFADSGHAKPYFSLEPDGSLKLHNAPVPPKFQLRTNQFPEVIRYSGFERLLMKSMTYRMVKPQLMRLAKNLRLIDPDMTTEWILGRAILRELVLEIKAAGAEPLVIIIPPDRWAAEERKTSLHKSILRFAKKEKMDLLDLTLAFREAVKKDGLDQYYIQGDGHWTVEGHRLAEALISGYLKDRDNQIDF